MSCYVTVFYAMCLHLRLYTTGVCEKSILRRKHTLEISSFENTKSETGEQLLLKDCRTAARVNVCVVSLYYIIL